MLSCSPATLTPVSDVWQGPGWWLASDGKWYPPEAQPGGVFDPSESGIDTAGSSALAQDDAAGAVAVAVEAPLPEPETTPAADLPVEMPIAETNGVVTSAAASGIANGNANLPGWQAIVEDEPAAIVDPGPTNGLTSTEPIAAPAADTDSDDLWSMAPTSTQEPELDSCLLYTSPSPRDATLSRMPSSA